MAASDCNWREKRYVSNARLICLLAIKCDDVKVIYVPQYENLTVEIILTHARKFKELEPYWPDDRDIPRIGRTWLCSMLNPVIGARF